MTRVRDDKYAQNFGSKAVKGEHVEDFSVDYHVRSMESCVCQSNCFATVDMNTISELLF